VDSLSKHPVKKWIRSVGALGALALLICCFGDGVERAEVEPGEWLPGGETTNTLLLGVNAYIRPVSNITDEHELNFFFTGNAFFNQPWVEAPASTSARDGLGPLFNARSCSACHPKDGRGRPVLEPDEDFVSVLIRLSRSGSNNVGGPVPDPVYGHQLQNNSLPGVPTEGQPRVRYEQIEGVYPDGERYTLSKPIYTFTEMGYGDLGDDVRGVSGP
jgi:CxxC motif-containing protein (DUF1111 family)